MIKIDHIFEKIISLENLFSAWQEFKCGKRSKKDVQKFEFNLEDNLFKLQWLLKNKYFQHGSYQSFSICDPKPRIIHKASVRDRILHHAVFRILYPIFDPIFIKDSYSCRLNKGTHKGVDRLKQFVLRTSRNYQNNCFALKCDIAKFFASIDHAVLKNLIRWRISDSRALILIDSIIDSYHNKDFKDKKGLPLGNLTSQLFANIYLNEFDQFIKHKLKVKFYLRYTDDFIIVNKNEIYLKNLIAEINKFLSKELILKLHPDKIIVRKISQGIDFLGYITLPNYRLLRTKTKNRMIRKINRNIIDLKNNILSPSSFSQSIQSYLGVLDHCNGNKVKKLIISKMK